MFHRRVLMLAAAIALLVVSASAFAQAPAGRRADAGPLPTIEDKTAAMKKLDGYFPLFWDERAGQLWMEISRFNAEVLHSTGYGAGLGSNDLGIDRGALTGSRIVTFERVGPRVLMVAPNYRFRSVSSAEPASVRGVRDAFARSVLWGFQVAAESNGRVLVDLTDFLVRDALNTGQRMRPGTYRVDATRSSVYLPMTQNFPKNTEIEVELTFVLQPGAAGPGAGGGGGVGGPPSVGAGGAFFEGVRSVAASPDAATIRVHHSIVELPDANYKPRIWDPRSGYGDMTFLDYTAPLGTSQEVRYLRRHRLNKVDPKAKTSDPVKPIVYYLDPGAPEPIRSALLEGARWWNQAFEAAGYRNAFRVELLPEGVSPLDIRYNVINWVHRSTRGWSTGGSVIDPRTGEIIKGVVTLGSLRIRQDYMLAEGLLSPYKTGTETPPELKEWALARIRQLSAHEIGHTLGFGHQYYDSTAGRISVMDYPHPLVSLKADGTFDYSKVYAVGIGDWDKVAVTYGYQDFPAGTDEATALKAMIDDAWKRDMIYLTNQDMPANPRVDQWSNGTDPAAELARMMEIRRVAISRFGEQAIKLGEPLAAMEEVFLPLYLYHRYQVEAAASALGGQHYIYAMRGDGREPYRWAPAAEQRAALKALLDTIKPSVLVLPDPVLKRIPPRPDGYDITREMFPRYTGMTFDVIAPAAVAAYHTVSNILQAERAARIVEQHAVDATLPGLEDVIDDLLAASFGAAGATPYEAEIARAVQRVVIEELIGLAASADMPQVRAIAAFKLAKRAYELNNEVGPATDVATRAHASLLTRDIKRFLDNPESFKRPSPPVVPPGAPIGDAAMDWLRRQEPLCSESVIR
ncbi:MAG: zinc-dependent metalloprotease [Acidobacteria bacterium]|nr:zinc-dependent metalloprotease [Acidobacteriota bacterium]